MTSLFSSSPGMPILLLWNRRAWLLPTRAPASCRLLPPGASSIVDGLVGQGREIAGDVERHDALREHNANQVLFGV